MTQYVGTWYEIYRDEWVPYEKGLTCVIAEYGATSNPKKITITNIGLKPNGDIQRGQFGAKCKGGAQC